MPRPIEGPGARAGRWWAMWWSAVGAPAGVRDVLRQVANVAGAVFQAVAGALSVGGIAAVSEELRTVATPAPYTFGVWVPLFVLSLGYAVHQARPSRRADPQLRRIGWWTAVAFVANGTWEIVFPAGLLAPAQLLITVMLVALLAAHLGTRHRDTDPADNARPWLVALPVGAFAGWITAATFVELATTLDGSGLFGPGALDESSLTPALLVVAVGLAIVAVRAAGRVPAAGRIAYVVAVVWGLLGVAVGQYDAPSIVRLTAVGGAVVVGLALLGSGIGRPWPVPRVARTQHG